jgi:integrase
MPGQRQNKSLTDVAIRAAIRTQTPRKLYDGDGLYIYTPTARWRWERVTGRTSEGKANKWETVTHGQFPDMGLKAARDKHAEARKLVSAGKNPNEVKRAEKGAAITLGDIAERWYAAVQEGWSESRRSQMRRWLDQHVIPELGKLPIQNPAVNEYLKFLADIKAPFVAVGCRYIIIETLMHYCRSGQCPEEKLAPIGGVVVFLGDVIKIPETKNHKALKIEDVPQFRNKLDSYRGYQTKADCAWLLLMLATRKRELTEATWAEFNLEKKEFNIQAHRMKGRKEHWVPLPDVAVRLLRGLKARNQRRPIPSEFVFPQERDPLRPLRANSVNALLRKFGIDATVHGFRACFATWAGDEGYPPNVIDANLAHLPPKLRRTYNRAMMRAARRKLAEAWAAHIESYRDVELQRAAA